MVECPGKTWKIRTECGSLGNGGGVEGRRIKRWGKGKNGVPGLGDKKESSH